MAIFAVEEVLEGVEAVVGARRAGIERAIVVVGLIGGGRGSVWWQGENRRI